MEQDLVLADGNEVEQADVRILVLLHRGFEVRGDARLHGRWSRGDRRRLGPAADDKCDRDQAA